MRSIAIATQNCELYPFWMSQTVNTPLFWLGVCVEFVSTLVQNYGMNLMRKAHRVYRYKLEIQNIVQSNDKKSAPNYCKNTAWWVSLIVFVIGVILDFVALAFIPCTISLPVGSIGIGFSCICAHFMLNEAITWMDITGTLILIAGAFMIVGFNVVTLSLMTAAHLTEIFNGDGLYFFIAGLVFWAAAFGVSYIWKNAFTYALVPGSSTVFTILFGSCVGQMALASIKGDNQMNTYQFWLCILGLIIALLLLNHQLYRANCNYDNMIVIPVYFTTTLILNVLSGIFFFKYFENIGVLEGVMFGIGIALVIGGCFLISVHHIGQSEIQLAGFIQHREDFVEQQVVTGPMAYDVLQMQ